METHHLAKNNSVLKHFLSDLRDINIQQDRMRFRKNMERIGELLAYEMSKTFVYKTLEVQTPLGIKDTHQINEELVICGIFRAGLALHQGFLNYFDQADNAFISAYRKHRDHSNAFDIEIEYLACPSLENKTLILVDPMLATGRSFEAAYKAIESVGAPKNIHVAAVVGTPEGIKHLEGTLRPDTKLWIADIDEKLNEKDYIVPGLGDAGDLSYGAKLQH
ncbi:uracil phosphoribosyltransferase [Zhouia amylolytica]|uniref:Uracil phosphoribosyltransferase n=1 Tax=Zhouia amylolytica TaxID=376730 RepID=A0A1I6PQQ6_9FLAO|nr:uracil phosphoribosyltransferase [Zhouia amylolytica]SFS42365.1 uracil phosphoribosyltransferase [Zhouia amylolytica]